MSVTICLACGAGKSSGESCSRCDEARRLLFVPKTEKTDVPYWAKNITPEIAEHMDDFQIGPKSATPTDWRCPKCGSPPRYSGRVDGGGEFITMLCGSRQYSDGRFVQAKHCELAESRATIARLTADNAALVDVVQECIKVATNEAESANSEERYGDKKFWDDHASRLAAVHALPHPGATLLDELQRYREPRSGDIESQAKAWAAVWGELESIGLLEFLGSTFAGHVRAVEFIRHVGAERKKLLEVVHRLRKANAAETEIDIKLAYGELDAALAALEEG